MVRQNLQPNCMPVLVQYVKTLPKLGNAQNLEHQKLVSSLNFNTV